MSEKTTTLKILNTDTDVYPNVKDENIPDTIQRKLTAGDNVTIENNVISVSNNVSLDYRLGNVLYTTTGNLFNINYIVSEGQYNQNGQLVQSGYTAWFAQDDIFIKVEPGERIYGYYLYAGKLNIIARQIDAMYDANYNFIGRIDSYDASTQTSSPYVTIPDGVSFIKLSGSVGSNSTDLYPYIRFFKYEYTEATFIPWEQTIVPLQNQINNLTTTGLTSSFYKDYTLITCGDSITQGIEIENDPDGLTSNGVRKTYGWQIAQAWNIPFVNAGVSGGTMASGSNDANHFLDRFETLISPYKGKKVIITFWFGWNDQARINAGTETLGSIYYNFNADTSNLVKSSFIGAYQTVLYTLLKNDDYKYFIPLVIIPYGVTAETAQVLYELCLDYGIKTYNLLSEFTPFFYNKTSNFYPLYLKNGETEASSYFKETNSNPISPINLSWLRARYTVNGGAHPTYWGHQILARRIAEAILEA